MATPSAPMTGERMKEIEALYAEGRKGMYSGNLQYATTKGADGIIAELLAELKRLTSEDEVRKRHPLVPASAGDGAEITYPPEMLPKANGPAEVVVVLDDGAQRVVYQSPPDGAEIVVRLLECAAFLRENTEYKRTAQVMEDAAAALTAKESARDGVLEMVETTASIRDTVLEEAAKVAEEDVRSTLAKECRYEPDWYRRGKEIAAAIRALKSRPTNKE